MGNAALSLGCIVGTVLVNPFLGGFVMAASGASGIGGFLVSCSQDKDNSFVIPEIQQLYRVLTNGNLVDWATLLALAGKDLFIIAVKKACGLSLSNGAASASIDSLTIICDKLIVSFSVYIRV